MYAGNDENACGNYVVLSSEFTQPQDELQFMYADKKLHATITTCVTPPYILVSLICGTIIPISFKILMKCFFYIYMQQDRGSGHATIITCITPPYISFILGLLLLHVFTSCLVYILPSSPVLLHVCIPVLLHIYCTCFSTFLALSSLHPSTL